MKRQTLLCVIGAVLLVFSVSVATANTIDLTTNSMENPIYGGIAAGDGTHWRVIDQAPTGTGNFDPFLRLDANLNKNNFSLGNDVEVGRNTNATNPGVYNDMGSPHTHAVLWSDIGTVLVWQNRTGAKV